METFQWKVFAKNASIMARLRGAVSPPAPTKRSAQFPFNSDVSRTGPATPFNLAR